MPPLARQNVVAILEGIDSPLLRLLVRVARLAQRHSATLWLVGGGVRDLMLGRSLQRDLDLAVEGDVIVLADALTEVFHGRLVAAHRPFGTATVALADPRDPSGAPLVVDLARTRSEMYQQPGALPIVQFADIARDLFRRDFSINAMALELRVAGERLIPAHLLDPFAGRVDLEAGVLRVLHDASFDDDPTRILRGLRLASRLRLQIEAHTRMLLAAALDRRRLECVSPDRLRTELCLALEEPRPDQALRLADDLAITPHIWPKLGWSAEMAERCVRFAAEHAPDPLVYAGLLTYDLSAAEREQFIAYYRLPGAAAQVLRDVGELRRHLAELTPEFSNSALDARLRSFSATALTVVHYAAYPPVRDMIEHYQKNLCSVNPHLDGYALQRLGVPPGPRLGQLLRALRSARLDGLVATRAEEESWVRQALADERQDCVNPEADP